MKTKILIYVENGNVRMIHSNEDIDIIIIDKDMQDIGENPVSVHSSDSIRDSSTFHELFNFDDNSFKEIREKLKRLHY